jgi:hypothetical protein
MRSIWQSAGTVAVAVVVGASGLLVGAVCPAPNDSGFVGVLGDHDDVPGGYDRLQSAGFKYVRFRVPWSQIEPNQPIVIPPRTATQGCDAASIGAPDGSGRNWAFIDDDICDAYLRGFSILANITSVPNWASGSTSEAHPPDSAHATVFRDFVRALAERHGDKIAAYAMWNEPDLDRFWTGNADAYKDKILTPGYQGLQDAKASLGISPAWLVAPNTYSDNSSGAVNIGGWIKRNGSYVVPVDVVGIHTYGPRSTQKAAMNNADNWVNNNPLPGGSYPRYWVTEGGFTTGSGQNSHDDAPGAALVEVTNHCLLNTDYCFKYMIFHLTDVDNQGPFGLLAPSGLTRNRFCTVENEWYPPYADPCPCSDGKAGCTGNP